MLTKTIKLITIIAGVILLSPAAFAQQNHPQNKQDDPQWVEQTGFKGKIFDIKNRNPGELARILKPLGSGFKGAIMQPNDEYKTITVRDFPENIAAIEEAIKRLDAPLPPKPPGPVSPDIEIAVHILITSESESAGNSFPSALTDVIKQLQMTLNYKSYHLLTSIVQRTKYANGSIEARGTAVMPEKPFIGKYILKVSNIRPQVFGQVDSSQISMGRFEFYMEGFNEIENRSFGETRIITSLSVRDGEKTVVGNSSLRDKAVILVLTTKIIK
ncbi:MAG TPA: secretin N-terminal domain-containing protein [Blastocatellia bacterium]|nr:secretin N-terminal domain-containing protein [Blastocatellia bacterium]